MNKSGYAHLRQQGIATDEHGLESGFIRVLLWPKFLKIPVILL